MDELRLDGLVKLSPYDNSLPAKLLQEAFNYRAEESKAITQKLYADITKNIPQSIVPQEASEEKIRLVVDTSDDFLKDYKDGAVKLAYEKGHMVAQVKKDGKYGSKLPIKEENYVDGPNSLDTQNAVQLQAIQEALVTISEQIQAIDENVKEVLKGQHNDRLALYYSGVALFIEAYNVQNKDFQRQLMAQSLKALSDGIFQLTLTLQTDINYLERKEYDKEKKYKYNHINEKMANIDRAFMAIHQASIMKAAIYCYQGEIKAMTAVLQEYGKFIEGTIVKNAEMLSLCDSNEKRIQLGVWKKRANLRLEVKNVVEQLQAKEQYIYLEDKEIEEYESV